VRKINAFNVIKIFTLKTIYVYYVLILKIIVKFIFKNKKKLFIKIKLKKKGNKCDD
jgi:hypothetical protein